MTSTNGSSQSLLASLARQRLQEIRAKRLAKRAAEQAKAEAAKPPPPPESERFARYREDPVGFAVHVLGLFLYPRQEEILRALCSSKKKRVAVRSGHKCGKSITAVVAALWTACCFPGARVILTAPTGRQVRDVLWKELRDRHRDAKLPLGGRLAKTPSGGFKYDDGREIIGFSTDKTEGMAGYSGSNVLWIIDEASGFDESIFEAIDGNAQSGARIFIISNPTQTVGFFYDAFHLRAAEWDRFRISSEEAAVYADRLPGLSRPEEVEKRIARHGRAHPIVRVRVLGEFPSAAADTVVSLHLVELGKEAWKAILAERIRVHFGDAAPAEITPRVMARAVGSELGPLEFGVDVARFGDDDTVITPRRGKFLFPQIVVHGYDSNEIAGVVIAAIKDHRIGNERAMVKVDGIGYGSGVVDRLQQAEAREFCQVVDVNVSVKSDDEESYPNLRSQLWFGVADFLAEGGTLPQSANDEDGMLDAELMTPKYKFDTKGRRVVEPKVEIKKRMNRSPDRADSVALAIYKCGSLSIPAQPKPTGDSGYRWADEGRGYG